MEDLKRQRDETEQARTTSGLGQDSDETPGPVLSAAQEAKKRKLDDRRALIEAKRQKVSSGWTRSRSCRCRRNSWGLLSMILNAQMLGGKEAVDRKKKEAQDRAVDALLRSVEQEMQDEK